MGNQESVKIDEIAIISSSKACFLYALVGPLFVIMTKDYGQPGKPVGFIGRVLGQIMAWHNQPDNIWTLELLELNDSDHILEIGYGPGKAIQTAYELCPKCQIVGIDHSEEMLAAAKRINKAAIAGGSVDLRLGDIDHLNFPDNTFNKAFSINCIYFWPNPIQGLQQLLRVLKVGGKLAITVRDKNKMAYRPFSGENLQAMLFQAGFSKVEIHSNGLPAHPLLCGLAIK